MYLNTPDAYEYYTEAQRLITVRDYGTIDVTEKLNDCYDHFKAAIEKMSVWSGKYKTKDLYTAYFDVENIGSSIIAETGKTYDESTQDNNAWQLSNGSYEASYQIDSSWVGSNTTTHLSVYGDSYIMLYDGVNDITAPLKFRYYSNTGTFCDNNGLLSIYINNDDLGYSTQSSNRILLTGVTDNDIDFAHYHWNEVRGDTDGNYQQNVANYEIGNDRYYTTGSGGQDESGQVGFQSDTGTIHYYGNSYVTYTGTPTSTLTQINPNVIFVDAYGNHTSFGNSGVLCSRGTNYSNYSLDGSASLADGNASTYYIIDVSSISKNLQTGAENLMNADLSSFSYDMMDVFNASQSAMEYEPYDEITGRDDNGYISKDSMQSQAQSIADEIDTISDSLNSDAIYIDVDGYSALKTIRNNNQINQMYATGNSAGYTTDTWNTFKDAYEAAVEQINTLADNAFVNEFDTNGNENTTVKDVVENLYKAYYGLRQCADFTEIREVSSEDDIQSGLSTGLGTPESQNYAYGLWYDFESAYNAVQDFNAQYGEGSESNEPKYASSEQEISTEGFTFTVEVENTDKYSEIQQKSFDLSQALRDAADALAPPAPDYTAYNAATDLLKYQDVAAFAAGSSASVYETIREQGTKDASVTYNNGVGTNGSAVIATPAYNGVATAYVTDESGTVWKNQSSQDALDKQTASILTDINTVNTENDESRSTFDVTFTYQIGEDGAPVTQQYTYYYGQTFPAVVPDGLTAYKWEVTANGTTMEIPAAQTYNAYITSDVTIVAYCSEEAIENEITVQILNQYGHLVQEYVVADDTQITVDKNTFSIGGNTYTSENTSWLANTPFYTFDGWQVNGHNYNNGSTFTASSVAENGTVTLKMKFTVASDYYEVTMDGGNVANALTGEEGTAFHYDTKVTATPDESAYGIAIEIDGQYYAVSYGTEPYSFYTVGEAHLYSIYKDGSNYIIDNKVVSDSNVIRKLDMKLPFSYTISQWVEPKFTPYSATTANIPDDANVVITEVGTIYTQNATDNFVIGEPGVTAIAAKNQLDTEQYFIRFNLKEGQTVYARSYVKYSFVNSDGTTVQTVDYGNIVQCTY